MPHFLFMLATYAISLIAALTFYVKHITNINALNAITRYPALLSPIHLLYAFIFIIFILLGRWIVVTGRAKNLSAYKTRASLFSCAMLLQALLFAAWHYEYVYVMVCMTIMLGIVLWLLYKTYPHKNCFVRSTISVYAAWVSFFALFMIELTFVMHSFRGFGLSQQLWVLCLLTLGAILALYVRFAYNDRVFPAMFIVSYFAVAFNLGFNEMLITLATLFLIGAIAAGMLYLKKTQT